MIAVKNIEKFTLTGQKLIMKNPKEEDQVLQEKILMQISTIWKFYTECNFKNDQKKIGMVEE